MFTERGRLFEISSRSRYKQGLFRLFVFALIVRLIYLLEMKNSEAFSVLLGDAESYDRWAQTIAGGNWLGSGVFYQSPFYPYFLGLLYTLFGRQLFLVRMIQIVMGSLSCLCLAGAGASFFNKKTGFIGGFLLSIYPTAIFLDGCLEKTGVSLFLMALLLLLLGRIQQKPVGIYWLLSGTVLGCLGLVRENSLIFFFIILLWLFVGFGGTEFRGKRRRWLCCFMIGLVMVLLPVGIRNKIVGNDFVLTTAQFGSNFYIGNNRTADGLYRELSWSRGNWYYERADATRLAEQQEGRRLGPSEVSRFWFHKAFSEIRSAPADWVRLMLSKWTLLWNVTEVGDTESEYAYYRWSWLLHLLGRLFHFGVLCPLAVCGIWMTWENRRRLWILYLMLFGYAASVSFFYIFARYRAPLVPILCLFAAAGILNGFSFVVQRKTKKLLMAGAVALIIAVFVNREAIPSSYFVATTLSNLAVSLENRNPDKARALYLEAVRLNPSDAKAHFRLGCYLMRRHQYRNAVDAFLAALKLNPENDMVHYYLGLSYQEMGLPESAHYHFEEFGRIRKRNGE